MLKFIAAATMLLTPISASAQSMVVPVDRVKIIVDASVRICKKAMTEPGSVVSIVDREALWVTQSMDEKLFMMALCRLYAQGLADK